MKKKLFIYVIIINILLMSCHNKDYKQVLQNLNNANEEQILKIYEDAIKDNHSDCLSLAINKNAMELEFSKKNKNSLIDAFFEQDDLKNVELFIKAGISPDYICEEDYKYQYKKSLLMIASLNNYKEIVDFLIKKKANVNLKNEETGRTALIYAAAKGNSEIFEKLLKAGADVSLYDNDGLSAVHYAAKNDFGNIINSVPEFINYGTEKEGFSPLMYAIACNKRNCINEIVKTSDLSYKTEAGCTALHIAANQGTPEIIQILTNAGADYTSKNSDGQTPLDIAVINRNIKNVTALIKCFNHNDRYSYGTSTDKSGTVYFKAIGIAILRASVLGYDEILNELLNYANTVEINQKDSDGSTALIYAIEKGNNSTAKILCKYNFLINEEKNDGTTPIMAAIKNNNSEMLDILIEKKADLTKSTNDGKTIFTLAKETGNQKIINKLENRRILTEVQMNMVSIPGYRFAASKYEVTQELYEKVLGIEYPCGHWVGNDARFFDGWYGDQRGEKYPAILTYNDAIYFCNKLSTMCGLEPVYSVNGTSDYTKWRGSYSKPADYARPDVSLHYKPGNLWCEYLYPSVKINYNANGFRLPLKKEWDIAANGDKKYTYSGSDNIYDVAWFEANSDYYIQSVGQKKPNSYGLYDMTGNVEEWCYEQVRVGGNCQDNADKCELNNAYDEYYYDSTVSGLRLFRTVK